MKTIQALALVVLLAALPFGVKAAGNSDESNWTGTLVGVNTADGTITGKHLLLKKTFRIGEHCIVSTLDKKEAALSDLRPGEVIQIHCQKADGILVADRITEKALRYEGMVHSVDPKAGAITMEEDPLYQPFRAPQTFQIAGDCQVVLWNGHDGKLADVQPGDRISVVYELPDRSQVAYRIRDKSLAVVGTVDAINLPARTLKAREGSAEKEFALGDHCQVILPGDKIVRLKDLKDSKDLPLGQKYKMTYEAVNGVNVLDRITPLPEGKQADTASAK